jgi:hypothetical protein
VGGGVGGVNIDVKNNSYFTQESRAPGIFKKHQVLLLS